jgi:hypothetical protein
MFVSIAPEAALINKKERGKEMTKQELQRELVKCYNRDLARLKKPPPNKIYGEAKQIYNFGFKMYLFGVERGLTAQ